MQSGEPNLPEKEKIHYVFRELIDNLGNLLFYLLFIEGVIKLKH
jgi:hypothetical protein